MTVSTSRRAKVRWSLMAMLVSYLRDRVTGNTGNFTLISGQPSPAYPFNQNAWSFPIATDWGTELVQIIAQEEAFNVLPEGITLEFNSDKPQESKSMPQLITLDFSVVLRLRRTFSGNNLTQQISLLVDRTFWEFGGRIPIMDYSVYPAVAIGGDVAWVKVPRGQWQIENKTPRSSYITASTAEGNLEETRLSMSCQYSQPQTEL